MDFNNIDKEKFKEGVIELAKRVKSEAIKVDKPMTELQFENLKVGDKFKFLESRIAYTPFGKGFIATITSVSTEKEGYCDVTFEDNCTIWHVTKRNHDKLSLVEKKIEKKPMTKLQFNNIKVGDKVEFLVDRVSSTPYKKGFVATVKSRVVNGECLYIEFHEDGHTWNLITDHCNLLSLVEKN